MRKRKSVRVKERQKKNVYQNVDQNESCKLLMKARLACTTALDAIPLIHKTENYSIHSLWWLYWLHHTHTFINTHCQSVQLNEFSLIWFQNWNACVHHQLPPLHCRTFSVYTEIGVNFSIALACMCVNRKRFRSISILASKRMGIIQSYEQRILKITQPIWYIHQLDWKKWWKLDFLQ